MMTYSMLGALAKDTLSAMGVPLATAESIWGRFQHSRAEAGRQELLRALERGEMSPDRLSDEDAWLGSICLYSVAVQNGAARRNLRLMAEAMAGMASRHVLEPDSFGALVPVLSHLSRDQILVAGRLVEQFRGLWDRPDAWEHEEWEERTRQAALVLRDELVPAHFPTQRHLLEIYRSLTGTGLVMMQITVDGGGRYEPSPTLCKLAEHVDFVAAANDD